MYEQAFLHLDSYRQTLKREKTLPAEIINLYLTFVSLYQKLIKIRLSPIKKNDARMLANEIKKSSTVVKNWLIQKCGELL
jgi:hypothetical protein